MIRVSRDKQPQGHILNMLAGSVGWEKKSWRQVLERSSSTHSAWDREFLAGFARTEGDGGACWVFDVAVSPRYQRNGIGTLIMQDVIDYARKNYDLLILNPSSHPGANRLYEKLGFEREGKTFVMLL